MNVLGVAEVGLTPCFIPVIEWRVMSTMIEYKICDECGESFTGGSNLCVVCRYGGDK